ncbi:hypothetical protein K470DRAFT_297364 [Piedraia hortae CBS 480.64]|uniref:Deacetylase complex subunit Sds3 n=1 Tax=Piedraia hortae CBS 480.64 TaxID=1314780 RepID=A0A6A7C9U2_9PEZI|nr:hypothetical protein K470DRAFT_297364 [Piedraia hortae CBS 480.64]
MAVQRGDSEPSTTPPPTAHMTKRDIRQNRIKERLRNMVEAFNSNEAQHYRSQLQAMQVGMALVQRVDSFADNGPMEDGPEELRRMVEEQMSLSGQVEDNAVAAMATQRFGEFVREVNDALEKRDAQLTALHNSYQQSVREVERVTQQKLYQADEEHKALSSTIRQRLTTSISKKRQQLLRDKEQLDIADSNAFLMNPTLFSINNTNPTSPGAYNRKTRHLRHRAVSPGGDVGKKRKLAVMEDEGDSPVRAGSRERSVYAQYEAPAYSLERIFTEKELSMATATAQIATYRYFNQPEYAEAATEGGSHEEARPSTEKAQTPPPSMLAPEMERSISHQVLTRNGAKANPLAAFSELATDLALASGQHPSSIIRKDPFAPYLPQFHAITRAEKSGAPAPPPISAQDMEHDFDLIRRLATRKEPELPLIDTGAANIPPRVDRPANLGFGVAGAETVSIATSAMRRTLSTNASEAGGGKK